MEKFSNCIEFFCTIDKLIVEILSIFFVVFLFYFLTRNIDKKNV